jgi:hypothetical protein
MRLFSHVASLLMYSPIKLNSYVSDLINIQFFNYLTTYIVI